MSAELIQAVIVTATLLGADWDEPAARMFVDDLRGYPDRLVLDALRRCRQEVRGRLTVADVIARINDGRPGPDEAYAALPRDDRETVVWTTEARTAWAAARDAETDQARRAAFRERYIAEVARARSAGAPPRWALSEGYDPDGRRHVIERAIAEGKLPKPPAPHPMPAIHPGIAVRVPDLRPKLGDAADDR